MHRFYASPESFSLQRVILDEEETRHLRDVLRLRTGNAVAVFNGVGQEFQCEVKVVEKKAATLAVTREIAPAASESPLQITAAVALLNGEKYDLVIQKAVELGISSFVPLHTERCEVRLKDAPKRLDRWRRIALGATKQSGRARIMQIADPVDLQTLFSETHKNELVMFSERGGGPFTKIEAGIKMTAVFGPKGGWADDELEMAASANVCVVTLGGRVLRVETAVIALTAILQHRFGDLV